MSERTPYVISTDGSAIVLLPTADTLPPQCMPALMSMNKSFFLAQGFSPALSNNSKINFSTGVLGQSTDISNNGTDITLPANKRFLVMATLAVTVALGGSTFSITNTNLTINAAQSKSLSLTGNVSLYGIVTTSTSSGTISFSTTSLTGTLSLGGNSMLLLMEL